VRPAALAVVTALFAPVAARAVDPCADVAQAVATLRDGDPFQLTTQLFAAARLGCEREAKMLER
jgi:hypothetical protein